MDAKCTSAVYRATLFSIGELHSLSKTPEGSFRAILCLGQNRLELPIFERVYTKLAEHPIQGTCQFLLYPRTDREGVLSRGTWLGDVFSEQKREDGLEVLGELASVDRGEGTLNVRLHPNLKGGLKRSFQLPMNASLELIESLPGLGCAVLVMGSFREKSLRLVANSISEVPLPPKRHVQPTPASKSQHG